MLKKPESLFKYESFNTYAFQNLLNSQIFLNQPVNFNDPLEFMVNTPKPEEISEKFLNHNRKIKNLNVPDSELRVIVAQSLEDASNNDRYQRLNRLGCYCLSGTNNSLLMWAHYAEGHKGYCLEFNKKYQPFSDAEKVKYRKSLPHLNADILLPGAPEGVEEIKKILLSKSDHWKYEEEYRYLEYITDKRTGSITVDPSKQLKQYQPEALKAVYFGYKMEEIFKYAIFKILSSRNPSIKFFNARIARRRYELKTGEKYKPKEDVKFSYHHLDSIISECEHFINPSQPNNTHPLYKELQMYRSITHQKTLKHSN